jgi:hypothetical protein
MAEKAFIQMLRRVNKGSLRGLKTKADFLKLNLGKRRLMPLSQVSGHLSDFRATYRDLYKRTTGGAIPNGKVVVPKELHERLTKFLKEQKVVESRAAAMTELDRTLAKSGNRPGGKAPQKIEEKGSFTFQNNGWMPTLRGSLRGPSKRELNVAQEISQAEQRAWEQLLSDSGTKAKNLTLEEWAKLEQRGNLLSSVEELARPSSYKPKYRTRPK